jgi:trk system potassium uptake protein TrkH
MWARMRLDDFRVVLHYTGMLVCGLGVTMLIPLGTALIFSEWAAALDYVAGAGVAFTLGMLMVSMQIGEKRVNHVHALAITAFGWVIAAAVAAVPLSLSGNYPTYLDAAFDAISGFTVSGLTVVVDLDHMALSHNMWRHMTQFLGGQGIVVTAISFAVGLKAGAFSLYMAEGRDERILPNVLHTARFIWTVTAAYVVAGTLAMFAILLYLGMPIDRGLLHSFWISVAAFDTGGFAPQRMNMMYYHNYMMEIVALVLMMAGSINFGLHAMIWRGDRRELFRNMEVRVLAFVSTAMALLVAVGMTYADWSGGSVGVFRKGVFQVIAGQSAGHQTIYPSQFLNDFGGIGVLAIIMAMGVGGSMSSTGGGIKALRAGILAKTVLLSLKQSLAPPSAAIVVRYRHLGERILQPGIVSAVTTIFLLYLATYLVGGIAGAAYGYNVARAAFESVSATANSGLSIGVTSASMPVGLKLVYMFQMWAGRLEFIAVMVLGAQILLALDPRRLIKKR